jgi:hypothetical protein
MSHSFQKQEIVGTYDLTSTDKASYSLTDTSAFKIQFVKTDESITPYVSAKFCVLTVEGIKVFGGVFLDSSGTESTVIQIPITGQSIGDLVESLNTYADVEAEVENSMSFVSSLSLYDTAFTQSSGSWVYFSVANEGINSVYSTIGSGLRLFLTSPEPLSEQKNVTQSFGGYTSTNELYGGISLSSAMSVYDTVLYLGDSVTDGFSIVDLQKNEYVQIDDEIIRISKWSGVTGYISERNVYGTPFRMHPKGAIVRELVKNSFFDLNFGTERKQYRCVVIKNINTSEIAKDLKVFFGLNSRNNLSYTKIAIEVPSSDYYAGASSSSGITAFSVASLVGAFPDNHFVNAPIAFISGSNNGQSRLIKSFNSSSGTIELDERLPNYIAIGDQFYIDTAPSSRTKSGGKTPTGANISEFFDANDETNAISINVGGQRASGADLKPNEAIYVWIERSISESNDEFLDNRFALSFIYSRV